MATTNANDEATLNALPTTEGKWSPIRKGGKRIVAFIEVFPVARGRWASVPGESRFIAV